MTQLNTSLAPLAEGAATLARRAAPGGDDFYILRRHGHWSIRAGGSYFGQYASADRALPLAVRVARDAARAGAGTRVILLAEDGGQHVLWNGDQVSSLAAITSP